QRFSEFGFVEHALSTAPLADPRDTFPMRAHPHEQASYWEDRLVSSVGAHSPAAPQHGAPAPIPPRLRRGKRRGIVRPPPCRGAPAAEPGDAPCLSSPNA